MLTGVIQGMPALRWRRKEEQSCCQLGNYFAHRVRATSCKLLNGELVSQKPHELRDELVNSHVRLVCTKGIEPLFDVFVFFPNELRE